MSAIATFKKDIQKQIDEAKEKASNPDNKYGILAEAKANTLQYCLELFDIYVQNKLIADTEKGQDYNG